MPYPAESGRRQDRGGGRCASCGESLHAISPPKSGDIFSLGKHPRRDNGPQLPRPARNWWQSVAVWRILEGPAALLLLFSLPPLLIGDFAMRPMAFDQSRPQRLLLALLALV